jgi:hypothetical protein
MRVDFLSRVHGQRLDLHGSQGYAGSGRRLHGQPDTDEPGRSRPNPKR